MTDFSHNIKVNIANIFGELTLAKLRNLILTELGNDIKVIVQNEIKEHLENETPKSDQSVTNSYPKDYILKEKLNKKEALIKELIETIRKLTTNSLKQQPIQSESFTSNSDGNHHISNGRPVNDKEINLNNTNENI